MVHCSNKNTKGYMIYNPKIFREIYEKTEYSQFIASKAMLSLLNQQG